MKIRDENKNEQKLNKDLQASQGGLTQNKEFTFD